MINKYHIGFVCGFFDIIHKGHIDILKFAKSHCDYLIVAVGTDEFMMKRKMHPTVLSYEQRVAIVESIRYVDKVVPEEDLDKIAAQKKYHFDVMFAGNDHINEKVYINAAKELKKLGVDTIYIPRIYTMSSTFLRRRTYELEKKYGDIVDNSCYD